MIMKETKNNDPYKQLREQGNQLAKKLVPPIEDMLKENPSFENYVKIAVACLLYTSFLHYQSRYYNYHQ